MCSYISVQPTPKSGKSIKLVLQSSVKQPIERLGQVKFNTTVPYFKGFLFCICNFYDGPSRQYFNLKTHLLLIPDKSYRSKILSTLIRITFKLRAVFLFHGCKSIQLSVTGQNSSSITDVKLRT
jgi:hypothetical protein